MCIFVNKLNLLTFVFNPNQGNRSFISCVWLLSLLEQLFRRKISRSVMKRLKFSQGESCWMQLPMLAVKSLLFFDSFQVYKDGACHKWFLSSHATFSRSSTFLVFSKKSIYIIYIVHIILNSINKFEWKNWIIIIILWRIYYQMVIVDMYVTTFVNCCNIEIFDDEQSSIDLFRCKWRNKVC